MMKSLFITFSKHDLLASTTCRYINKIAIEGFGRSKDVAEFYDSSRPSYSLETINKVSDIIDAYYETRLKMYGTRKNVANSTINILTNIRTIILTFQSIPTIKLRNKR